MNNKGQTLVIFVILLPILAALVGYVIEKCDLLNQKKNLEELADMTCKYALDRNHSEEQIKRLALENDQMIEKININYLDPAEGVQVILVKKKKSIFRKIIGKDSYIIESTIRCIE